MSSFTINNLQAAISSTPYHIASYHSASYTALRTACCRSSFTVSLCEPLACTLLKKQTTFLGPGQSAASRLRACAVHPPWLLGRCMPDPPQLEMFRAAGHMQHLPSFASPPAACSTSSSGQHQVPPKASTSQRAMPQADQPRKPRLQPQQDPWRMHKFVFAGGTTLLQLRCSDYCKLATDMLLLRTDSCRIGRGHQQNCHSTSRPCEDVATSSGVTAYDYKASFEDDVCRG